MSNRLLECEIFEVLHKIQVDPSNKDRYGQVGVMHFTEGRIKGMLSELAFDLLKSGKSLYGRFQTYGGSFGVYKALNRTAVFYQNSRLKSSV